MRVVLCQGKMIFAKLIMRVIEYPVSHAALRYSSPDEEWIVHSSVGGIQPDWWFWFEKRYSAFWTFRAKFACADQALDQVVKRLGDHHYDYLSLVGFALVILLRKVGISIRNPLGSKNAFMCTELVSEWMRECNKLDETLKLKEFDSELLDPQMLMDYLRYRSDLFIEEKEAC